MSFLQLVASRASRSSHLSNPQGGEMAWGLTFKTVSDINLRAIPVSAVAKFHPYDETGKGRSPSVIVLLFLGAWGLVNHIGACKSVRRHPVGVCEHGD